MQDSLRLTRGFRASQHALSEVQVRRHAGKDDLMKINDEPRPHIYNSPHIFLSSVLGRELISMPYWNRWHLRCILVDRGLMEETWCCLVQWPCSTTLSRFMALACSLRTESACKCTSETINQQPKKLKQVDELVKTCISRKRESNVFVGRSINQSTDGDSTNEQARLLAFSCSSVSDVPSPGHLKLFLNMV